jgi:hypothetical protein
MKSKLRTYILSVLVFLIACCIVSVVIYVISGQPAPARSFMALDLLVDGSTLPPGWIRSSVYTKPNNEGARDMAGEGFLRSEPDCQTCLVIEDVHRFDWVSASKWTYGEMSSLPGSPRPVPGWTYSSVVADESTVSCYDFQGKDYTRCYWLARYQEIIIEVDASIVPGRMSLADIQAYVKSIDERVASYIAPDKLKSIK